MEGQISPRDYFVRGVLSTRTWRYTAALRLEFSEIDGERHLLGLVALNWEIAGSIERGTAV